MSANVANGPQPVFFRGPGMVYPAAAILCIAIVFTSAGAFDTDNLTVFHRLALWIVFGGLVVSQAMGLDLLARRTLPGEGMMAFVSAGTAIAATILLMTVELQLLKYTPLLPKDPDPWIEFLLFVAPPVGAIAGLVLLVQAAFFGTSKEHHKHDPVVPPLPAKQVNPNGREESVIETWPTGTILRVRACDHYLEVETVTGGVLVRGRMKDALRLLAGQKGLQVHRSWWLSEHAVETINRKGRDYSISLTNGDEIPVARSRVKHLRNAGWL